MLTVHWGLAGDLLKGGPSSRQGAPPPSPHTPKLFSYSQGIYTQKKSQNFYQLFLPHRTRLFFINLK